jgi:hypothetical protein
MYKHSSKILIPNLLNVSIMVDQIMISNILMITV